MKVADKAALAVGAVGTWIYIGGVDSDLWGRAALGAGMFLLALVAKKIGDYVEECREEQEEWEEERRDAVFAAWIRSGSLKEGGNERRGKTNAPPKSPAGQGRKRKLDTGKMTALRNAGWSYEKIADEMGCSAGTVWNYFNKDKEDKKDVSENQ